MAGKFSKGLEIPPLGIKILLEPNPPKSRILVGSDRPYAHPKARGAGPFGDARFGFASASARGGAKGGAKGRTLFSERMGGSSGSPFGNGRPQLLRS